MKYFCRLAFLAALIACQSKTKKVVQIVTPEMDYLQSKDAKEVINLGSSSSPVFSLDGAKIYYISKNRTSHRNTQIYEYDLILRNHRRITFQDGEISGVVPFGENQLMYSSTTDEIKEDPFVKEPQWPRAEIYLSDRYGNEITRLTHSPGYDAEMLFSPQKRQILFTSIRSGILGLYWLDPETERVTPYQVDAKLNQHLPTLSADEKTVYWVQDDGDAKTNTIFSGSSNGKDRKVVKQVKGSIKNLTVNSQGQLLYSLQPVGSNFSDLEIYDPVKNCTQVALKTGMNLVEPRFSTRNPNLMVFRASQGDKGVIYQWEVPKDLGPCIEQLPSDTMKP